MTEIRKGKLSLGKQLKDLEEKIEDLYKDLNELTVKKRQTYSQIMVALDCKQAIRKPLTFSYYISSAGWEPLYDFRVQDISKPLKVVYNANVFQSSGENWDKVNVKLSSNNPMLSGSKPTMGSLYLGRGRQTQYKTVNIGTAALTGRIFDSENGEALPFCNVQIFKGSEAIAGTTTDFDGMYTIKPIPPGNYTVKVSYVGFQTKQMNNIRLNNNQLALQDFALEPGLALKEVQIVAYSKPLYEKDQTMSGSTSTREEIEKMAVRSVADISKTAGRGIFSRDHLNVRGGRSGKSVSFIDGVKVIDNQNETNLISNSLKYGVTHLEYEIQVPYTIPSDGENYNLKIKEVQLDVDYVYYAVPKLDKDAFLTAKLTNWNELNLLSGKTSIYYEGTFTSESYLDVEEAEDTLSISLGRDKGILIARSGDKEIYDKRKVGKNIKETMGWEISIRNAKKNPIHIVVEDQYPLSDRKSIEVELVESGNAKIDDRKGKLSWELDLKAGEKKEVSFNYHVIYPKYTHLAIE